SPVAKSVTGSSNTTSKIIGLLPLGSGCPAPWLIVTVGGGGSGSGGSSKLTTFAGVGRAVFGIFGATSATPPRVDTKTTQLPVIPLTDTVFVVPRRLPISVLFPYTTLFRSSPVAKSVTGSSNTTSKIIGLLPLGSGCPAPWLIVTVGGVVSGSGGSSKLTT